MADIVLRSGDTLPVLTRNIQVNGEDFDLTSATVTFTMTNGQTNVIDNVACTVDPATYGIATYEWTPTDALLPPGFYLAWFKVTVGGDVFTDPASGPLTVQITSASVGVFTYSGDPEFSQKDKVRFYLQDTDGSDPLLTDQEINSLIAQWYPVWNSEIYVAAMGAEVIAARFAREVSTSADGVSIGVNELQQKYNDLANSLRDMYKATTVGGGPDAGGLLWGETFDPSLAPLSFWRGMHDNYRAGAQDYGGQAPNYDPYIYGIPGWY